MADNNQPAAKINLYPVSAIVWRNISPKGGISYNISFEKSYKDAQGNYKSSASFSQAELLLVAKVADLAHSEIYKLRASDRGSEQSEEEAA
jgi:hypothetical protein